MMRDKHLEQQLVKIWEKEAEINQRNDILFTGGMVGLSLAIVILVVVLLSGCAVAAQSPINDQDAILAIIGEAENQGYDGMLAVACAIRNRGTLRGVYGLHAPRVRHHKYDKGTWLQADQAWRVSKEVIGYENDYVAIKPGRHYRVGGYDISGGANHWENIKDFGKPKWADSCEQTVIIGDHVFYKCKGV